ncbi:MAG TPA: DUF929 family protein [Verrucomicrobiae bacterium]|nr:DUF929 family protein [Verrucomicrobiae bacterium]
MLGISGGVVAIVVLIVILGISSTSGAFAAPLLPAPASLVHTVTSVPTSAFDAVGRGNAAVPPTKITGAEMRHDGKPEMLFIGAEYCPYCALARWGLVAALSRFGHFRNLHTIRSSSVDVFPNTATFSFFGAHYTSRYLSFVPVEHQTNIPGSGIYASGTLLQGLTAQQNRLWSRYGGGGYPFIDVGGRYAQGPVVPDNLVADINGRSWDAIAADLGRPSTGAAKDILGEANLYTAEICKLTGERPAAVCRSSGVAAASTGL